MDGIGFDEITANYNLDFNTTGLINNKGNSKISKNLAQKMFSLKDENISEFINLDKKYYLIEMTKVSKNQKDINNKEVRDAIKAQIIIENKINENTKLAKEISNKTFTREQMDIFAKKEQSYG